MNSKSKKVTRTSAIHPDKIRKEREVRFAAEIKRKAELLKADDFAKAEGRRRQFLATLGEADRALLKDAHRERMYPEQKTNSEPGMTQSEYSKQLMLYEKEQRQNSIERANKVPIQEVQGGAPGLKSQKG